MKLYIYFFKERLIISEDGYFSQLKIYQDIEFVIYLKH